MFTGYGWQYRCGNRTVGETVSEGVYDYDGARLF